MGWIWNGLYGLLWILSSIVRPWGRSLVPLKGKTLSLFPLKWIPSFLFFSLSFALTFLLKIPYVISFSLSIHHINKIYFVWKHLLLHKSVLTSWAFIYKKQLSCLSSDLGLYHQTHKSVQLLLYFFLIHTKTRWILWTSGPHQAWILSEDLISKVQKLTWITQGCSMNQQWPPFFIHTATLSKGSLLVHHNIKQKSPHKCQGKGNPTT